MEKKEKVKIVQEDANRRMVYIVVILAILFFVFVAWIIKTQFLPVMEHGCSAYGEGYEEVVTEYDKYREYKCCKKGNVSCITVTVPKEE